FFDILHNSYFGIVMNRRLTSAFHKWVYFRGIKLRKLLLTDKTLNEVGAEIDTSGLLDLEFTHEPPSSLFRFGKKADYDTTRLVDFLNACPKLIRLKVILPETS